MLCLQNCIIDLFLFIAIVGRHFDTFTLRFSNLQAWSCGGCSSWTSPPCSSSSESWIALSGRYFTTFIFHVCRYFYQGLSSRVSVLTPFVSFTLKNSRLTAHIRQHSLCSTTFTRRRFFKFTTMHPQNSFDSMNLGRTSSARQLTRRQERINGTTHPRARTTFMPRII